MNRVRQWFCALWLKVGRRDQQSATIVEKLRRTSSRIPESRGGGLEQLHDDIFGERESADEEIHFQSVTAHGVFSEKSEMWFRDGDALRSVTKRGRIISCSGAVVGPESIQAVCGICGGFEAGLIRCAVCAAPLCHLHVRLFEQQGAQLQLCPQHHSLAVSSRNTWESWPSRRRME